MSEFGRVHDLVKPLQTLYPPVKKQQLAEMFSIDPLDPLLFLPDRIQPETLHYYSLCPGPPLPCPGPDPLLTLSVPGQTLKRPFEKLMFPSLPHISNVLSQGTFLLQVEEGQHL